MRLQSEASRRHLPTRLSHSPRETARNRRCASKQFRDDGRMTEERATCSGSGNTVMRTSELPGEPKPRRPTCSPEPPREGFSPKNSAPTCRPMTEVGQIRPTREKYATSCTCHATKRQSWLSLDLWPTPTMKNEWTRGKQTLGAKSIYKRAPSR